MKKTTILLLLLVIGTFSIQIWLGTGALAAESKEAKSATPKIAVPEPNFDFGKVLEGETVTHAFVVENQGHAPLRILNVQTSCGCTTAQKPETIAPGAKENIVVQGNTRGYGGSSFNKTITVTTDDPAQPSIALRLTGRVASFARIEPNHILISGREGDALQAQATITPEADYPFKIVKTTLNQSLSEKIQVTLSEQKGVYHLHVRNLIEKPGNYRGNILLATDSSVRPQLSLFVSGRIVPKAP